MKEKQKENEDVVAITVSINPVIGHNDHESKLMCACCVFEGITGSITPMIYPLELITTPIMAVIVPLS